jgi:excisionase family DNA binding protein
LGANNELDAPEYAEGAWLAMLPRILLPDTSSQLESGHDMTIADIKRQLMTPEQVAQFLQIDRSTVYRYIREGKLSAFRIGRGYRISPDSVDLLLKGTSTRPFIELREYTDEQIEDFLREDKLSEEALKVVETFLSIPDRRKTHE